MKIYFKYGLIHHVVQPCKQAHENGQTLNFCKNSAQIVGRKIKCEKWIQHTFSRYDIFHGGTYSKPAGNFRCDIQPQLITVVYA